MDFAGPPRPSTFTPNTNVAQTQAKVTFFYENNGTIIAVEEPEAHIIHRKFKQIGVSDGLFFHAAVNEAKKLHRETGDLPRAQEIIRQGERDEIEIARGHFQVPRNFSYTDSRNNPLDQHGQIIPPNRRT